MDLLSFFLIICGIFIIIEILGIFYYNRKNKRKLLESFNSSPANKENIFIIISTTLIVGLFFIVLIFKKE
jgi:uncharacterized membrane protein YidH (DUF202 family)